MNLPETPTPKPSSDSPPASSQDSQEPVMLCWTLLLREQEEREAAGESPKTVNREPYSRLSPKLKQMLKDATPEQREEAIKIVSKLLARRLLKNT